MKVHLIDGTYELFRSFFGAPSSTSPAGQEVGATRGFLRSLASLLREPDATHVACAFDHVIESFRNQMFDGYKTGEGIDEKLHAQFPLVERAAHALGVTVWPMVEFEADDAIAAGAARYAEDEAVEQILLCSPDKDLAQCVRGDRIVLVDRRRKQAYDEEGVITKFGVAPESIPSWLGLVGDAADGIPGIPRWGAKSAATVLRHYRTWDQIPADVTSWEVKVRGAQALATSLGEHRDEVRLYAELATLRTDVPLTESLDELHCGEPRWEELQELCDEIGDDRFVPMLRG